MAMRPHDSGRLDRQAQQELHRERQRHAQGVAACSGPQDCDRLVAESRLHLHNVDRILIACAKRCKPAPATPRVSEFSMLNPLAVRVISAS
jgi:hypothetical protein